MDEPFQRMNWGGITTRAGGNGGDVDVKRNEWVKHEDWVMSKPYDESALAHDIQIPGWPNFDGYYYGNYGGSTLQHTWKEGEVPNGGQPCGDVTEFEIQYVSAWFRTHTKAQMAEYEVKLHLSDFFIQNVSCDNDQKTYGSLPDNNGSTGFNGDNVFTGDDNNQAGTIWRKENSHEKVNFSLDQLGFQAMNGEWTHVNNFNNQNSNFNPEEATTNPNREIKYITSSGTEDFRCHPSFSTDPETNWIKNYVLVRLEWKEKVTNSASPYYNQYVDRVGYYLAFDFKAYKAETKVDPDGYYSNWIVKITPGHFAAEGKAKRIMCEDLGGSFDFDFNDIVVDVAVDNSGIPVISVQAAGGTMPVYVEPVMETATKEDSRYELHKLLGAASSQPMNVLGDYSHQHAPAIFRGTRSISKPEDIKIIVYGKDQDGKDKKYDINGNRANLTGGDTNNDNYPDGYGSPNTKDEADNDYAPRAFACPTSVKWMKELQFIDKSYPGFKNWVKDENYVYYTTGNVPLKWHDQSKVQNDANPTTSYLYYPGYIIDNEGPEGYKEPLPEGWTTLIPDESTAAHCTTVDALSALLIRGYTGDGSIIQKLEDYNVHFVTLTAIVKSKIEYPDPEYTNGLLTNGDEILQGIMIPADPVSGDESTNHDNATLKYKGSYYTKDVIQSWQVAQRQNYGAQDENSVAGSVAHNSFSDYPYTYAIKMTFERSQLLQATSPEEFVQDLFLFIKGPNPDSNADQKTIFMDSSSDDVKIFNWHVHY